MNIFFSAVLMDNSITAAELEVENASSWVSLILVNVNDRGLCKKFDNYDVDKYHCKKTDYYSEHVCTKYCKCRKTSFDVIPAIKPKVANGAKCIAHDAR